MPSFKDSPKPLRKRDPNPLFEEVVEDGYVVKAASPIERQRTADGSPHSMRRPSSVEPTGYDESLYLGEDKIDKSTKSVSAQMDRDDIDADEVVKAFLKKSNLMENELPPGEEDEEDKRERSEEDTEKAVIPQEGKKPSSLPIITSAPKKATAPRPFTADNDKKPTV